MGRRLVRRRLELVSSGEQLGDYPPAVSSWANTVKANGGAVVVWPGETLDHGALPPAENAGKPAARYSSAKYGQLFNAGKIDPSASQTQASNGDVYVLAPADVIAAAPGLIKVTSSEEAGLEAGFWEKLGLPNLSKYARYGVYGVALVAAILLAVKFLPSPRKNPPRRARRRHHRRSSRSS